MNSAWLNGVVVTPGNILPMALRRARSHISVSQYRTQTDITAGNIVTAFSWLFTERLHAVEGMQGNQWIDSLGYESNALSRGSTTDEIITELDASCTYFSNSGHDMCIQVYNSAVNRTAEQEVINWLNQNPHAAELEVRPQLTISPDHRVHLYKYNDGSKAYDSYVCITNKYVNEWLYKLAGVLIKETNLFGDKTDALAGAYYTSSCTGVSAVLEEIYSNFAEIRRQRLLTETFEKLGEWMSKDKARAIRTALERATQDRDNILQSLQNALDTIEKYQKELLYITVKGADNAEAELISFLKTAEDKITYARIVNNELVLEYTTPLKFWEKDKFLMYKNSTVSNSYTNAPDWVKELLTDILEKETIELLITEAFALDMRYGDLHYRRSDTIDSCPTGIPNPHHHYYNCWGDNTANIIECVRTNNDYTTALATVFAAVAGINLTDSVVFTRFVGDELNTPEYTERKCLRVKETNEVITIKEYILRGGQNASN